MRLSLVIPVYNEEEVLPYLLEKLGPTLDALDCEHEIVFVNDGSRDASARILSELAASDPRVKVISFSRNFGHQPAITAGLDFASGDAVVVMDADLQDPPELLEQMVQLYRQGFDVVSAQRIGREGESFFKRTTASLFYALMRKAVDERLQSQVGDFRLFSRQAVLAIRGFREQHRFMRGMVAWLGLKEAILPFHRPARAAGTTKYPAWKMAKFAWTAISSFSALPLKLSLAAGISLTLLGLLYGAYVIFEVVVLKTTVRGWASVMVFQALFSGATLICLGLVGDYVARIYEEVKGRPLYVVGQTWNIPETLPPAPRSTRILSRHDVESTPSEEEECSPTRSSPILSRTR